MREKFSFRKINKETVLYVTLLLILILWRLPFLDKGIDYTDTGFSMENYKNLFLGEGIRGIGRFYTIVLGGFIYKLLPAYHLLVYRILHWVLNLLTYFFSYKIFEKHLNKNLILIGLIAVSFSAKSGEALFSYYPLTSCLLLLSIWLIITGLKDNNNIRILLSGLISGLNVFVRLPNILFLSMVLALFVYLLLTKKGIKCALKVTGWYIIGAATSLVVTIVVMIFLMGFDGVINSFMRYVRLALGQTTPGVENFLGIEEVGHHSVFANVRTVAIQLWKSIKFLVILAPLTIIGFCSEKIFKDRMNNNLIKALKLILYVFLLSLVCDYLASSIYHTLYIASILSGILSMIIFQKTKPELVLYNLLAILMSGCSVFGSDAGMTRMNIVNTVLILVLLWNLNEIKCAVDDNNKVLENILCLGLNAKTVVIVAVLTVGVFHLLPKTYNDANFLELNCPVNAEIKALKGMKTSENRAKQIDEYYTIMSKDELQYEEVAIFGYFPLGVVIGNQKDYFEEVQPCIDYPGVSVTKLLKNIQEKDAEGIKPVIVISYVHMLQNNTESFTSDAKKAVLEYMLSLYDYETYSNTDNFTVYVPAEK